MKLSGLLSFVEGARPGNLTGSLFSLEDLDERTRQEFLNATDPKFIHHSAYRKELPDANVGGAEYQELTSMGSGKVRRWEAIFEVGTSGRWGTSSGVSYKQRIVLLALEPLLRAKAPKKRTKVKRLSMLDKVRYVVDGDLQVSCTCPAYLYWGYKYINTSLGTAAPGAKERRAPDIRNPQRRGIVCKHLDLVLSVLPFVASSITRDLKKALRESVGSEEYGMARLSSVLY